MGIWYFRYVRDNKTVLNKGDLSVPTAGKIFITLSRWTPAQYRYMYNVYVYSDPLPKMIEKTMHTAMETHKFWNQTEFLKWKEEEEASSHICFVQQHGVSYHRKGSAVDDTKDCSSGKHLNIYYCIWSHD